MRSEIIFRSLLDPSSVTQEFIDQSRRFLVSFYDICYAKLVRKSSEHWIVIQIKSPRSSTDSQKSRNFKWNSEMCERATNKKLNWIHINWDRVMTIKFAHLKKSFEPWLWNLIQLCLRGQWWWNNFPLIVFSWHVLIFVSFFVLRAYMAQLLTRWWWCVGFMSDIFINGNSFK